MTVDYSRQLRWLTAVETAADDAVTPALREMAYAINNYKAHAGALKILDGVFPGAHVQSADGLTGEIIELILAMRRIPDGYDRIHWNLCGKMNAAPSGQTCTWRLYSMSSPYPPHTTDVLDTTLLSVYSSSAITISSTSSQCPAGKTDLKLSRGSADGTYLMLTSQNSSSGSGHYSQLYSVSATAQVLY